MKGKVYIMIEAVNTFVRTFLTVEWPRDIVLKVTFGKPQAKSEPSTAHGKATQFLP